MRIQFETARAVIINANDREHWAKRAEKTRVLRSMARFRAHGCPAVASRVRVIVTYTYPNRRSPKDDSNLAPSTKALCDGLTDAGLWPDDNRRWVEGPDTRIGEPDRSLRSQAVRITIDITPADSLPTQQTREEG